jgi:hypothetical protein
MLVANRGRMKSALSRCRRAVELPLFDPHRQLRISLPSQPHRCAHLGMTTRAQLGAINDWTMSNEIARRRTRGPEIPLCTRRLPARLWGQQVWGRYEDEDALLLTTDFLLYQTLRSSIVCNIADQTPEFSRPV